MISHVERFTRTMNFQAVDRLPTIEWAGYWRLTFERWQREGLPPEWTASEQVREGLGLDAYRQIWVHARGPNFNPKQIAEGFPIRSEADYDRLRPLLFPDPPFDHDRVAAWAGPQRAGDMVVWFSLDGFFWFPRTLFGIEGHLLAFYDHPRLMHRINEDLTAFNLRAIDSLCRIVQPSFMTFGEDMSYNHGPMLSKACFDEFLAPYYRRVIPAIKDRGVLVMIDSDGQVEPMIPWLEEVGIEGILPLERMAGVDVARIRKNHPKWRMIGAFDKTVMHRGEAAVRAEFERLLPVMRTGGFIPSVDHQTPPEVSLAQYKDYLAILKEYVAKV